MLQEKADTKVRFELHKKYICINQAWKRNIPQNGYLWVTTSDFYLFLKKFYAMSQFLQ